MRSIEAICVVLVRVLVQVPVILSKYLPRLYVNRMVETFTCAKTTTRTSKKLANSHTGSTLLYTGTSTSNTYPQMSTRVHFIERFSVLCTMSLYIVHITNTRSSISKSTNELTSCQQRVLLLVPVVLMISASNTSYLSTTLIICVHRIWIDP